MEQKIVKKRIPKYADYHELMKRKGGNLTFGSDEAFRNLLDNVHLKCSIEAEDTHQHGDVVGIIRDRYGIPVAVKVQYEEEIDDQTTIQGIDYIAMADVSFWEPFDHWVPNENYYDYDELEQRLLSEGYVWDDERGYYNAETGDSVIW